MERSAFRWPRQSRAASISRLIAINYRRLVAHSPSELVGRAALRLWPVSGLARRIYAARMTPGRWERTNSRARALYRATLPELDGAQSCALRELREQGIHKTSAHQLLGPDFDFRAVKAAAAALVGAPDVQRQISGRRSSQGVKWYVVRVFGMKPSRPVPSAIAACVLDSRLLDVVNSYLGLASRLIYLDLWYNLAVTDGEPPVDSELWHRDGEDNHTVRLFLYLSDVDAASGPVTYLRETQPGGRFGSHYPNRPPIGSYPPEPLLFERVPPDRSVASVGEAGTLTLYDGCGFHRGGRATRHARWSLVATYASDAAFDQRSYRLEQPDLRERLSPAGRYAIDGPVDALLSGRHGDD